MTHIGSGSKWAGIYILTIVSLLIITMMVIPTLAVECAAPLTKTITTISPNTGLVLWEGQKAKTTFKDGISIEYSYFPYNKITDSLGIDGKPIYDWSLVEAFLTQANANGHSAIIRFYYEYPNDDATNQPTRAPSFVKAFDDYSEISVEFKESSSDPIKTVFMTDWRSEKFRQFHLDFYTTLAAKYDNDPRLAYLQVGFGWWSEYHLFNAYKTANHIIIGQTFPSMAFQHTFLAHVQSKFVNTPYSISVDAYSSTYTNFAANSGSGISSYSFGLFDDSFMNSEHELVSGNEDVGYNEECWRGLRAFDDNTTKDRLRMGPAGGEISYWDDKDQKNFLLPAGIHGHTFTEQATKYHLTYMLANDAPSNTKVTPAIFKEASMMMGYEFSIVDIQFDRNAKKISFSVKNTGIAAAFHRYNFQATFSSTTTYISDRFSKLQKGETQIVSIIGADFTIVDAFFKIEANAKANTWLKITSPKVSSAFVIPFKAECTAAAGGGDTECDPLVDADCDDGTKCDPLVDPDCKCDPLVDADCDDGTKCDPVANPGCDNSNDDDDEEPSSAINFYGICVVVMIVAVVTMF